MKINNLLTLEKYISQTIQLNSLTESECRLDAYIQGHFNELPFHGIVDLARNAMVSKATVGRFLNKLGFTGYSSFRRELEKALSQQKLVPPLSWFLVLKRKPTSPQQRLFLSLIKM